MIIDANDILPNGTPVQVGTRRGTVESSEVCRAHPSGFVTVHTIKFNQRAARKLNRIIWEQSPETSKKVNYSFIQTI